MGGENADEDDDINCQLVDRLLSRSEPRSRRSVVKETQQNQTEREETEEQLKKMN